MFHAIGETPVDALDDADEDLATKIDALGGPEPDELEHLRVRDPEAVGEAFPALRHWIDPIVRAETLDAKFAGGEFGASRRGVPKSRGCGGHCGVDLHAERGRPIVAVAAGVLVRVERSGSGLSGRYVRLRHADGTLMMYMHLERVVDGIAVGDRVSPGEQLGTLGSTGVSSGVAHLHLELEIPKSKQDTTNGDHRRGFTHWIDAAPFLRQSRVYQARRPQARAAATRSIAGDVGDAGTLLLIRSVPAASRSWMLDSLTQVQ